MARYLVPLLVLGVLALLAGLLLVVPGGDWLPVLVYLVFAAFLAGVLYAAGVRPVDPAFPLLLFWLAFTLKLLGSAARLWTLVALYDDVGDAMMYHGVGQYVAQFFQRFDLSVLGDLPTARGEGTANLIYLAGLLYAVLPPSLPGAYFAFATLAFAGSVLYYRAFRFAFPSADPGFYRFAVFFLPSILFWPSSLGKEAWVFFSSGMVACGLAKYARQTRLWSLLSAGLGLALVALVRPHFAAFLALAAGSGYLLFHRASPSSRSPFRLVGAAIIVVGGAFTLQPASEFLGLGPLSEISWEGFTSVYAYRQQLTVGGGSRFIPPVALGVLGFLYAPVTVLLRPFPWEAHNFQAMAAALESVLWLYLFWSRRRVLWARLRSINRDPWVAFAAVYAAIMILALTTIGNFGILVRQRTAILPFLWVLFA